MASQDITSKGAKTAENPQDFPEKLVTVCDPSHPGHEGRDPYLYDPNEPKQAERIEVFFESTMPGSTSVGMIQLPTCTWEGDRWQVLEGSKRVMAWRVVNERRLAMGLEPVRVPFTWKKGKWTPGRVLIGHTAAQYNREVPDDYTRVRHAALLLGRAWEQAHVAGDAEPDIEKIAVKVGLSIAALDMGFKWLPKAAPSVVAAMRPAAPHEKGMCLSAAILFCRAPEEDQTVSVAIAAELAGGRPQDITVRHARQALAAKKDRPPAPPIPRIKVAALRRAGKDLEQSIAESRPGPTRDTLRSAIAVIHLLMGKAPDDDLPGLDKVRKALGTVVG